MRHWKKILSSLKNPVQQGRRLSINGKKKTKMLYMLRSNSQWDKEDLSFTEKKSQNIQCEVFVENVFPHEITLLTQKKKKHRHSCEDTTTYNKWRLHWGNQDQ